MLLPARIKICFQPEPQACLALLRNKRDASVFWNVRWGNTRAYYIPNLQDCYMQKYRVHAYFPITIVGILLINTVYQFDSCDVSGAFAVLNYGGVTSRQSRKFAGVINRQEISELLSAMLHIGDSSNGRDSTRGERRRQYRNWLLAWKSYLLMRGKEFIRRENNSRRRYDEFSIMLITVCAIPDSIPIKLPTNIRLVAATARLTAVKCWTFDD